MAKQFSWYLFIAFVISKLLWNGLSEPLAEVHWDSVFHLYYAKQFAETALIKNYAQQAAAIAAQVDGYWPREEQFSTAYWRFSRLGHIALLGMIVKMFGSTEEAIRAAHWLYHTLMALTMVLGVMLVIALVNHLGINRPQHVVLGAAAGSAVLYMMSDIYSYLGRSLVSEVPAMFLLTIASLLLITGLNRHSIVLLGLSGFCAFLAYSVRLEAVWLYISFYVVLVTTLWIMQRSMQWARIYAFAGSVAFTCYLLYAWYFYPLANPYLFILFAKHQAVWGTGEWTIPIYISMSVAGGLLWIGGFVSIRAMTHLTAARMALAWLGVTLLPIVPYLIYSSLYTVPLQVRMLTGTLVLPLLFASTLGWASLWEANKRWLNYGFVAVTVPTVFLIVISMSSAFERLQGFSSLGIFNRISTFLLVPRFERMTTYRFDEMNRISHVLYSQDTPVFLVYNKDEIEQADLSMIRFFGPAYPPQANLTMLPDNSPVRCEEKMPTSPHLEKVSHCIGMTTDTLQRLTGQGITVFFLTFLFSKDDIIAPFSYTEVLRTQSYRLGTIVP